MNYLSLIFKNPFRNKTRSLLAILGIAIGIATIVALGLITVSLETSTETTLKEGTAEITAIKIGSINTGGTINENYTEKLMDINGVNTTAGVMEATYIPGGSIQNSDNAVSVMGIRPDRIQLEGIKSINGSFYRKDSNEAIIGKTLAEDKNYTINDNITLFGEEFKITGIYESGSLFRDTGIYTNLEKIQNLTDNKHEITEVLIKIDNNATLDDVNNEINDNYNDSLTTITSKDIVESTEEALGMINTATTAIEALAIVIGGLGVINTMMMTVFERTREIGVLKSVGWTKRRILTMILGESIVITLISAIIGSVLGTLAVILLFNLPGSSMTLVFSLSTFVKAFTVALVVGIIGGLYPAFKASNLSPTESLRYE